MKSQKVSCSARALIVQPRYLICDEVSSMLDVSTQASLLAAIRSEQDRRKIGVLLITHDLTLAKHWCDSIASLSLSRILI
jgi:peptide/nickel transport system ATP-binding protein